MGQDVSIVFAAADVAAEQLVEAAATAFAEDRPGNLVVLFSRTGPACVRKAVPAFTSASLWADVEDGSAAFASALSRMVGPVVALTMADHSCVGGWQVFEDGQAGEAEWSMEDYTECGIRGIERAFGVELRPTEDDRTWFVEQFLDELSGVCVFGSGGVLRPGATLSPGQVEATLEHRIPGAQLECVLFLGYR